MSSTWVSLKPSPVEKIPITKGSFQDTEPSDQVWQLPSSLSALAGGGAAALRACLPPWVPPCPHSFLRHRCCASSPCNEEQTDKVPPVVWGGACFPVSSRLLKSLASALSCTIFICIFHQREHRQRHVCQGMDSAMSIEPPNVLFAAALLKSSCCLGDGFVARIKDAPKKQNKKTTFSKQ